MVKIIANPKKVIKILQAQNKYFATSKLQVVKDKTITKDLLDYERSQKNQFKKIICHKIGMVYMKGGQASEEEILGNRKCRTLCLTRVTRSVNDTKKYFALRRAN